MASVVVSFATGHDAVAIVGALDDVVIQAVGSNVGQCCIPFVIKQTRFLVKRGIGPPYVQTARWHFKLGQNDLHAIGVDVCRGAGLHHFLDGLHARPDTRKPAHGNRMHTQVQNILHGRGKENGQATGFENVIALVRCRGTFGHMVVAGHGQDTAPWGGASHVGVFEHIRAAIYAGAFAVPNAKHTIKLLSSWGREPHLLGAPERSCSQLFVDPRLKHNVVFF